MSFDVAGLAEFLERVNWKRGLMSPFSSGQHYELERRNFGDQGVQIRESRWAGDQSFHPAVPGDVGHLLGKQLSIDRDVDTTGLGDGEDGDHLTD